MHLVRPIGLVRQVMNDQTGATALEYGFLVAFVSAVLLGGAQLLAGSLENMFSYVASQVTAKLEGL